MTPPRYKDMRDPVEALDVPDLDLADAARKALRLSLAASIMPGLIAMTRNRLPGELPAPRTVCREALVYADALIALAEAGE